MSEGNGEIAHASERARIQDKTRKQTKPQQEPHVLEWLELPLWSSKLDELLSWSSEPNRKQRETPASNTQEPYPSNTYTHTHIHAQIELAHRKTDQ